MEFIESYAKNERPIFFPCVQTFPVVFIQTVTVQFTNVPQKGILT